MEDIEDMVGGLGGAPLGLHLPRKDSSPPAGRRNGTNAVVIKPRRRISANSGGSMDGESAVSTCMDGGAGETDSVAPKVPGTQVRVTILLDIRVF